MVSGLWPRPRLLPVAPPPRPRSRGWGHLGREASALRHLPLQELQTPYFLAFCSPTRCFQKGSEYTLSISFYCRTNFPKAEGLKTNVGVVVGQESGLPTLSRAFLAQSLSLGCGFISRLRGVRVGATSDLTGRVSGPRCMPLTRWQLASRRERGGEHQAEATVLG